MLSTLQHNGTLRHNRLSRAHVERQSRLTPGMVPARLALGEEGWVLSGTPTHALVQFSLNMQRMGQMHRLMTLMCFFGEHAYPCMRVWWMLQAAKSVVR